MWNIEFPSIRSQLQKLTLTNCIHAADRQKNYSDNFFAWISIQWQYILKYSKWWSRPTCVRGFICSKHIFVGFLHIWYVYSVIVIVWIYFIELQNRPLSERKKPDLSVVDYGRLKIVFYLDRILCPAVPSHTMPYDNKFNSTRDLCENVKNTSENSNKTKITRNGRNWQRQYIFSLSLRWHNKYHAQLNLFAHISCDMV